jgi:hypothetical protein
MALLIQKLEIMSGSSLTNATIWRQADADFICDFQTVMLYSIVANKVKYWFSWFYSYVSSNVQIMTCSTNLVFWLEAH